MPVAYEVGLSNALNLHLPHKLHRRRVAVPSSCNAIPSLSDLGAGITRCFRANTWTRRGSVDSLVDIMTDCVGDDDGKVRLSLAAAIQNLEPRGNGYCFARSPGSCPGKLHACACLAQCVARDCCAVIATPVLMVLNA